MKPRAVAARDIYEYRAGNFASRRLGRAAEFTPDGRLYRRAGDGATLLVVPGDTVARTPRARPGGRKRTRALDVRVTDDSGRLAAQRRLAAASACEIPIPDAGSGGRTTLHASPCRRARVRADARAVRRAFHGLRRVGRGAVAPHALRLAGQTPRRLPPHQRLWRLHADAPRPLVPLARLPGVGSLLDEHRRLHLLRRSRRRAPGGGAAGAHAHLPHRARTRLGLVPGRREEALRTDHQPGDHLDQQAAGARARAAHVPAGPLIRNDDGWGRDGRPCPRPTRRRAPLASRRCPCPRPERREGTSGTCVYP